MESHKSKREEYLPQDDGGVVEEPLVERARFERLREREETQDIEDYNADVGREIVNNNETCAYDVLKSHISGYFRSILKSPPAEILMTEDGLATGASLRRDVHT